MGGWIEMVERAGPLFIKTVEISRKYKASFLLTMVCASYVSGCRMLTTSGSSGRTEKKFKYVWVAATVLNK